MHTRRYPGDVQNALLLTRHDPDALWGDPVEQEAIWRAHNPYDLAAGQALGARLRSLGGTVTEDFYGNGTHAWPHWERGLHCSFPMLMQTIGA